MPQSSLFERHRGTLERALEALRERTFWTPYPEAPSRSVYGERAREEGEAAFRALLGSDFALPGVSGDGWVEGESSAYGIELGIRYPRTAPDAAVDAAAEALPAWRDAGPQARVGVCLEILDRLSACSFALGHAGMHTTGQPFVMAFQATGPHAQDRGLEAVAHGYLAMTAQAATATWEKQTARHRIVVDKEYYVVPRGVAVAIGCSTFPTWNTYPGLFASLVTGNPVVTKPHPRAVLPLALTIRVAREVLSEEGLPPDIVSMVVDEPGQQHGVALATNPAVRVIDFTGSRGFGEWLEENARQARVFTEKAAVNCIIVDSTDDVQGMSRNIAHSLALFSGQMCTAPQAIFVPRSGIMTDRGQMSHRAVTDALVAAVDELLQRPEQAENVLGAIPNPDVVRRIDETADGGRVLRKSEVLAHSDFPNARLRSPLVMAADVSERELYGAERFGPISFVVATDSTEQSLDAVGDLGLNEGALTTSLYTTSERVIEQARHSALTAGTTLSVNLTGELFVNQSAAFSDFHGTGNNPAANTSFVDPGFVAGRFGIVEVRRPRPGEG